MAEGFSSAVINVSNPIVAAKHVSPHCDLEVKKGRQEKGALSDSFPTLQLDESVLSCLQIKHKPSEVRIQTLSTRGGDEQQLFLGAALQFFVMLFAQSCSYSTSWI